MCFTRAFKLRRTSSLRFERGSTGSAWNAALLGRFDCFMNWAEDHKFISLPWFLIGPPSLPPNSDPIRFHAARVQAKPQKHFWLLPFATLPNLMRWLSDETWMLHSVHFLVSQTEKKEQKRKKEKEKFERNKEGLLPMQSTRWGNLEREDETSALGKHLVVRSRIYCTCLIMQTRDVSYDFFVWRAIDMSVVVEKTMSFTSS